MAAALVIPAGALAERWRFPSVALYGCAMSMVVYPLFRQLGLGRRLALATGSVGLGHGSSISPARSVVHLAGGVAALAGAIVVGPRACAKFTRGADPRRFQATTSADGDRGYTDSGLRLVWPDNRDGRAGSGAPVVRSSRPTPSLASAARGRRDGALCVVALRHARPQHHVERLSRGAGRPSPPDAPSSSTPRSRIHRPGGRHARRAVDFLRRADLLRVDDPVGAVSIHGTCGSGGLLAVGLFADGTYGQGWNGVAGTGRGPVLRDASQLLAQTRRRHRVSGVCLSRRFTCSSGFSI